MHQRFYAKQPISQQNFTKLRQSFQAGLTFLLLYSSGLSLPAAAQFTAPNPQGPATVPPQAPGMRATPPLGQTIVYVNPATGTDAATAGRTAAAPYRTITYAIQQAKPGTVIQLAPGNYTAESGETFPLVLTPGITLRGNEATNGQTIVIKGSGPNRSATFGTQNVTLRAAENTTITGITATNPQTRGTALWIESANPVVRKNTFRESFREGVFVTGTAAPIVEGNVFFGNSASGMTVVRSAAGEIRNNLFQKTGYGIAFGENAAPLVVNNRFTENRVGVTVSESARPILRSNTFESNVEGGVAIAAFSQGQPDLGTAVESPGNNIFRNNGGYAIRNSARENFVYAVGNGLERSQIIGLVSLLPPGTFTDVPQGYWAQPYVRALAAKNIISGFPDGTYRPDEPVTRAQFAAIISKAFASSGQSSAVDFQDVSRSFWGYRAIQAAANSGFMSGYPGGTFLPQQPIPRVQVLVSLASGLTLNPGDPNVLSIYQDAAQIPTYATDKVAAATNQSIVVNYPTTQLLNPNRNATRAEVAAFVYQALVNAGKAEPIASPYAVVPSSNSNPSVNPLLRRGPSPGSAPSSIPGASPTPKPNSSPNPAPNSSPSPNSNF